MGLKVLGDPLEGLGRDVQGARARLGLRRPELGLATRELVAGPLHSDGARHQIDVSTLKAQDLASSEPQPDRQGDAQAEL